LLRGGAAGNEQLTALAATLLLVLLAVEGATLLRLDSLMTVHAFAGMLLVPVVALKLGSVAWRMARYYLRGEEYVRRGPPNAVLRLLVAPVIVASTVTLFATGVALLLLDRTQGPIAALHKASFIVWFGATGLHVLTRVANLPAALRARVPGLALRVAIVGASLTAGAAIATLTLPAADRLQDGFSAHVGIDVR
jgi:hypothetical protein